jgi:ABC-type phosphate transport system substrate-binding protein
VFNFDPLEILFYAQFSVACKVHFIKYFALVTLILLAFFGSLKSMAIEVVTHLEVSDLSLTNLQLRRIFTMRQLRWSDDTPISIFVLPSQHDIHQRFSKEHLKIFPYQLNRIWHKLTYSGLGVAPTIVQSEQELVDAITKTPGSIGYLHDTDLIQPWQSSQTKKRAQTVNFNDNEQDHKKIVKNDNLNINAKGVVNVIKVNF